MVKKGDNNKSDFQVAFSLYLKTILVAFMSLFIYMSFVMLFEALGTSVVRYDIYEVNSATGETSKVGEFAKPESNESAPELKEGQKSVPVRSELSNGVAITRDIISTLFMLILLGSFPYSVLWSMGDRDKNAVQFGHREEDKYRGLKIGSMAAIPSAGLLLFFIIGKLGVASAPALMAYRFLNVPFLPLINRICDPLTTATAAEASWLVVAFGLLIVVYVPLFAAIGYWLGYKQISLTEKFIYVNPNKKRKRR